ncbi:MAG TPA: hypothetical protein VFV10_14770 [Gammaproteobacteria bacterium]|nr:hypothetical protein [Gammaproteobacteria bacterium]
MEALSNFMLSLHVDQFVATHDWVWPVCEIVHFFGMAAIIGTVGLADVRILGVAKGLPIAALEKLIPFGVVGFLLNVITGFTFVAGNPVGGPLDYLDNLSFRIKMILILIAGLNVLAFYFLGIARRADNVAPDGEAPLNAKVVAAISLVAWFAVIFFGRMIMYNDTLLYTLGI